MVNEKSKDKEVCIEMYIIKIIAILLGICLAASLYLLIFLNSEDLELSFEEGSQYFYDNYVVNNTSIPIEYRMDVKYVPNIIKMIKEDQKLYKDIPIDEVKMLEVQMDILNGDNTFTKKIEKAAAFLGITFLCYFYIIFNFTT